MWFAFGVATVPWVAFRRLTGYWDNGLRWKVPSDKLNKFDSTSHFEKSTGWSKWRVNTNE